MICVCLYPIILVNCAVCSRCGAIVIVPPEDDEDEDDDDDTAEFPILPEWIDYGEPVGAHHA